MSAVFARRPQIGRIWFIALILAGGFWKLSQLLAQSNKKGAFYVINEKKLVERITQRRKDNPEYKQRHCDVSKKYYQKRKEQAKQGGQ